MPASKFRLAATVLLVANLLFSSWPASVNAAGPVTFTMVAASTYLYSGPSKSTSRVFSIFKGETHKVLGRTADSAWLLLDFPFSAWVQTNVGTTSAEVSTVPVAQGNTSSAVGGGSSGGGQATGGVILPLTKYKLTVTVSSYIRSSPARANNAILSASVGQVYGIRGRTQDQVWLQIALTSSSAEAWINSGAGTIDTDILKLPVVSGSAVGASFVAPVSQATAAPVISVGPVAPTPGGFELGGQVGGFDYPDKMHYAGMTWVKRQVRWSPGANADAGMINDAHGKGFKVLLSVLGDPGSIAGGANYDDYARFVGDLAGYGADAIEVWNEMNIDREWPSGNINPASYVELLRRAYASIKAKNGGTLVISGAPAPTGFFGGCSPTGCDDKPYIEGLVAAGGLNYLDCLGMHYNEGVVSPTQSSGDPRGNPNYYSRYYQTMVDTYWNAEGGRKKLCFTELGYLSGEEWGSLPGGFLWRPPYNLTVAQHAQYLAQAAQLSRDQGKVRLMVIFNVDLKAFGADPQAGYAIVRPNGGCPACDALRAVLGGS